MFIVLCAAIGGLVMAYYTFYADPEEYEAREDKEREAVTTTYIYIVIFVA